MAMQAKTAGSRAKLRAYFLANVGRVLGSTQLRKVSGNASEWGRRVRELRTEEGYQILTHNDRSDLKPGQYVLLDPKPVPAFARSISKETRAFVLDRNGFTCQCCGAVAGEPHPYDPARRTRLQIGHIVDKSMGGSDDADVGPSLGICGPRLDSQCRFEASNGSSQVFPAVSRRQLCVGRAEVVLGVARQNVVG